MRGASIGIFVVLAVIGVVISGCLKFGSSTPEIADYLTGDAAVDAYLFPAADKAIRENNEPELEYLKEAGPKLKAQADGIRSQYSVPVTIVIAPGFSGAPIAWLKPDKVDWDATHTELLYDLTKPQEATLAIVEAIYNNDVDAAKLLMSDDFSEKINSKYGSANTWFGKIREIQSNVANGKPFEFEVAEDNGNKIKTVVLSLEKQSYYELHKIQDGMWKL